MPFGNEANDFASAFTSMLNMGMKYGEYKLEKEKAAAEKELQPLRKEGLETDIAQGKQAISASKTGEGIAKAKEGRDVEQTDYERSQRAAAEAQKAQELKNAQLTYSNAAAQEKRLQDAFDHEKELRGTVDATLKEALEKAKQDTINAKATHDEILATTEGIKVETAGKRADQASKADTETNARLARAAARPALVAQLKGLNYTPEQIDAILTGPAGDADIAPEAAASDAGGDAGATRGFKISPTSQANEAAGNAGTTGTPTEQAIPTQSEVAAEPETPTTADSPTAAQGNVIEAQAGTRNLPLNDQTKTMLEHAAAASGLQVRVKSGAQKSTGNHRTGSHRHDEEVGAADIELVDPETGKRLSSEVPEEQARIAEFMKLAQAFGATGFGAGREYMGDFTFHVGFGTPAIWGSDKTSKTAPSWLVNALGGAASPNAATPLTRPAAGPATTGALPVTSQSNRSPYLQTRPPVLGMGARSGAGGAGGATRDMVGQPQATAIPAVTPAAGAPAPSASISPAAPTPPTAAASAVPTGKAIGPLATAQEGAAPPSQAGQMMQAKLTPEDQAAINDTANALGIAPSALAAVIGYETMGTFDAGIKGGEGGNYQGVIQFSPDMQQKYGVTPNMSFAEQVRGPVAAYLKDRGLPPGSGLAEIYSVINAGSLSADGTPRWDATDQNGDLRSHVNRISEEFLPAAEAMFGGPVPGGQATSESNVGQGPTLASAVAEGSVTPRPSIPAIPADAEKMGTPRAVPEEAKITQDYIDTGAYAVDGVTAAKSTVKNIYSKVTQGAVPTQASNGQLRQIVSGDGGADPKAVRAIRHGVQTLLPEGASVSETQLNLATIGYAATHGKFNIATGTFEPDAKYQQDLTYEIYQNYKATVNQFMSIAQMKASTGHLDEAAKITLKADAYIPDGNEIIDFNRGKDGSYSMKVKNLVTNKVTDLNVTPQQMYAKIMGYNSTIDFDRRIAAASGVPLPSEAYEQHGQQLAAMGDPQITYNKEGEPQPAQAIPMSDYSQMAPKTEAAQARLQDEAQAKKAADVNKKIEPPPMRTETERKEQREQMARLYLGGDDTTSSPTGEPKEYKDEMTQIIKAVADPKTGKAPRIAAMLDQITNYNRDMTIDTIVPELAAILSGENPETRMGSGAAGTYGQPYERHPGKYEGTIGLSAPGSPVVMYVPTTYAKTIMQAADARAVAFQQSKRKDTSTSKGPKTWKDIGDAIKDQLGIQRTDPEAYKNPLKAAQKRASEVGIPMFGVNPLDQQMYDEMMK